MKLHFQDIWQSTCWSWLSTPPRDSVSTQLMNRRQLNLLLVKVLKLAYWSMFMNLINTTWFTWSDCFTCLFLSLKNSDDYTWSWSFFNCMRKKVVSALNSKSSLLSCRYILSVWNSEAHSTHNFIRASNSFNYYVK